MTVLVKAQTFQVVSDNDADPGLPIDTVAISESVSLILEPREAVPPAALRDLWMSWLSGHFAILLPSLATDIFDWCALRRGRPGRRPHRHRPHR